MCGNHMHMEIMSMYVSAIYFSEYIEYKFCYYDYQMMRWYYIGLNKFVSPRVNPELDPPAVLHLDNRL